MAMRTCRQISRWPPPLPGRSSVVPARPCTCAWVFLRHALSAPERSAPASPARAFLGEAAATSCVAGRRGGQPGFLGGVDFAGWHGREPPSNGEAGLQWEQG